MSGSRGEACRMLCCLHAREYEEPGGSWPVVVDPNVPGAGAVASRVEASVGG